jgi:hypothetical protein
MIQASVAPVAPAIVSPVLDVKEAAFYIHSTPGTMAFWRAVKKGPKVTYCGTKVLYKRADLDAWLENGGGPRKSRGGGRPRRVVKQASLRRTKKLKSSAYK